MARRRRTGRGRTKLKKGQCKTINTSAGRRRLCRLKNGRVKFVKLSYKAR